MGQRALITGAGSGIGRASALVFARANWQVTCVDIDAANAARTAAECGTVATLMRADVARTQDVDAAFAYTTAQGPLDAVVHCAGITLGCPLLELDDDAWRRVLATNGSFYVARAAGRALRERGGALVLLSSVTASLAVSGRAAYTASQAGVEMLVRSAALEWGPYGITVNAIAPGIVETPLARAHHGAAPDNPIRRAYLERTPLARVAQPDEIAGIALALCQPQFCYVTGQVLRADGGYSATGMRIAAPA
jgi:NAD(P)-dependent dehydrogenase (short-subunit alcohol dehydrogenase family)